MSRQVTGSLVDSRSRRRRWLAGAGAALVVLAGAVAVFLNDRGGKPAARPEPSLTSGSSASAEHVSVLDWPACAGGEIWRAATKTVPLQRLEVCVGVQMILALTDPAGGQRFTQLGFTRQKMPTLAGDDNGPYSADYSDDPASSSSPQWLPPVTGARVQWLGWHLILGGRVAKFAVFARLTRLDGSVVFCLASPGDAGGASENYPAAGPLLNCSARAFDVPFEPLSAA